MGGGLAWFFVISIDKHELRLGERVRSLIVF